MILEGRYISTMRFSLPCLSQGVNLYVSGGWRVHAFNKSRNWPKFWTYTYTVTFVKDIIVDQKYIIETPLNELL